MNAPFLLIPPKIISTSTSESLGITQRIITNSTYSSAAWPSSNRAIYVPFVLRFTILVTKLWVANGTTASNNFDIGIYDEFGTKIVSSGSIARSGTSVIQSVDITDTLIGPGRFFFGLAQNGTTGHNMSRAPAVVGYLSLLGVYTQSTAFALPATATFATPASAYIPLCGLSTSPTTLI